jgi:predicted exporter
MFDFAIITHPFMKNMKGDDWMILLAILLIIALILITFTVLTVSTVGAVGIIVFGDVIVCVVFIALLVKRIIKRMRR